MRIAVLSPIAWRTPPRHYGPWEQVASVLAEGLARRGFDVTLFATADSVTAAKLHAVCPRGYEEDETIMPKVWECLHISAVFERADEFDIIHNHFDFLPLSYSGLVDTPVVTTIHGFSSSSILPVYERYDGQTFYVSISYADRAKELEYFANVYHGIDMSQFTLSTEPAGDYLVMMGRIHPDKGVREGIEIARKAGKKLVIAGIIQDEDYFERAVKPWIDGERISFLGAVAGDRRDRLLGEACGLIHPISFAEPFGLSVVEAMACGTPVVAFRRGAMPELIADGESGFLVGDVDEAVEAVGCLGQISRLRCRELAAERFSADRMVEDYVRVYDGILDIAVADE